MNIDALAESLGQALLARGWRLATAESCTGGGIAAAVTDISGSSDWFERGFVTYSNQAKQDMLGVQADTLARHGAVSAETAREMVRGALLNSTATIAVAVTGIAGPTGGTPDKPVGLVYLAWAVRDQVPVTRQVYFNGDRRAVRAQTVALALQGLLAIAGDGELRDAGSGPG